MMKVQYFKAKKATHRFNKNQKVWVSWRHANCLDIYYRFRGKHRYVRGTIDRWRKTVVGELKTIDVDEKFARRIIGREIWSILYDEESQR